MSKGRELLEECFALADKAEMSEESVWGFLSLEHGIDRILALQQNMVLGCATAEYIGPRSEQGEPTHVLDPACYRFRLDPVLCAKALYKRSDDSRADAEVEAIEAPAVRVVVNLEE